MFKSKKRLQLEKDSLELELLKRRLDEVSVWFSPISTEISCVVEYLLNQEQSVGDIRWKLIQGEFTMQEYQRLYRKRKTDDCISNTLHRE